MTNNGTTPALTVTSAAEWNQGELIKLPSGKVVRYVSVDVLSLFMNDDGDMPDVFMQYIMQPKQGDVTNEESGGLFEAISAVLPRFTMACIAEPRVTLEATENSIGVNQVELADKMFLFQKAMGGLVKQGGNFPTESARNLATVPNISTVEHKSGGQRRAKG